MTYSGQRPTADCAAITDTLVNEIIELLADMDIKRMDVSCERLVFQNLVRSMPTLSPEVSAGRLQKFRTTLHTLLGNYRAEAELAPDEPDGSSTLIAIGRKASPATPGSPAMHTHGGCDQISNGAGARDGRRPRPFFCSFPLHDMWQFFLHLFVKTHQLYKMKLHQRNRGCTLVHTVHT